MSRIFKAAVLILSFLATPGLATPGLTTPAGAAEFTLLVLGDSLVAGYGLQRRDAFPAKLEAALKDGGLDVRVVNSGVSGDTSAGGRARLAWAFADEPDAMIVELGANDGLRGLPPEQTFTNLDAILAEAGRKGIPVLLAGMKAPPNLGREYADEFDAIYPRLAARHGVGLYPFFLAGVAARPALNQTDGIHPNAAGVDEIVRRILPAVRALVANAQAAAEFLETHPKVAWVSDAGLAPSPYNALPRKYLPKGAGVGGAYRICIDRLRNYPQSR